MTLTFEVVLHVRCRTLGSLLCVVAISLDSRLMSGISVLLDRVQVQVWAHS